MKKNHQGARRMGRRIGRDNQFRQLGLGQPLRESAFTQRSEGGESASHMRFLGTCSKEQE